MRNIVILTLTFFIFLNTSFASTNNSVTINSNNIEALVTTDGSYARLNDIQDGFENFAGTTVTNNKIILNFDNPNFNIKKAQLHNGDTVNIVKMVFIEGGGGMGGGGKPTR